MSSSFRRLAYFEPSRVALDSSSGSGSSSDSAGSSYLTEFIDDFIARCKPTSSTPANGNSAGNGAGSSEMGLEEARQQDEARRAWKGWFEAYAARATSSAEQQAWARSESDRTSVPSSVGAGAGAGAGEEGVQPEWAVKRKEGMLRANPRFVLRQWVLEELIKDMDDALGSGDEQGRRDARRRLNGVLQVSRPVFRLSCTSPRLSRAKRHEN